MTANKKNILAISGSTRHNSTNEAILKVIAGLYSDALDVQIYDNITALPYFNPDLDNEDVPESVKSFREQIEKADGVIICTPEYVFSLPGALKNAIEWTISTIIFSDKPTALIVASALGEKTFESLELVMKTAGAKIGEDSKLLIKGARSIFNEQRQISDEKVLSEINLLVQSLLETINAD